MSGERCGSVLKQEVAVAEAPKDTDTGESGIAGGLDVHVAVADIEGTLLPYSKSSQSSQNGVGGRLLADALGLVLTDGHLDGIREEMLA